MERRRRDLSVTIYRILLYLSRMRERDAESKRLMRIERATGIERKELKIHLEKLVDAGYVKQITSEKKGRGAIQHTYDILESGRSLRSDIGR